MEDGKDMKKQSYLKAIYQLTRLVEKYQEANKSNSLRLFKKG